MEKLVFAAATFPDTDSSIHQLPEYNHVAAAAEADRITDGVTETTSEKEEGEEDVDQGELQQQQNDDEARDFSIDDVKKMINAERSLLEYKQLHAQIETLMESGDLDTLMSLLDHVDKLHNDGEAELRMLQGEPISSKEEEEDGNCEIEEEISTSTMRTTRIISHSNNEINNYDGEANEEEENEETAFRYLAEIKRTHEEGEKKLFALKGLRQNMLLQKDQSDQQELLEKQSQELFAMQDLLNIIKGIPATAAAAMEERRINNSTDSMIEKQQGASATTQLDFADDEESQLDLINSAILSIQRDFAGGQDSEIQTQASETVQKLIHLAKQEEEMAALKHQIKSLEDDLESKRVFMLGRIQEEKDALESFEKQPNNNAEKLDKDKIAVEEDEDEQEEIASLMEQFTKLEQGLEALEKRQKMLSLLSGEELDDTVEDAAAKESELKMEEKEEGHDEIVATVGQLSNESQVAVNSMESKEKTATTKETASDLLALMGRLSAASLTTDLNPIKPENVPKSIYADTIEQLEQEYEHSVNEGSRRNNLEAMDQLEKLKPLAEEGAEKLEMDEDNDEEEGEVEEDLEETAQDFSSALASTEETLSKIDVNIDRVLANLEELEFWQPINDKDKKDVDTLRNCLRNQLFELQEVRNQMTYYHSLLPLAAEATALQNSQQEVAPKPKKRVAFADDVAKDSDEEKEDEEESEQDDEEEEKIVEEVEREDGDDTMTLIQNLLLEKVNEAPETVNTMEKKADSAHWSTNTWVEHAKVEKVVIEEENIVKTPPHITDAAEKFSFSSESSMTSSNVHMQKLFDQVKDKIYRGAASTISMHENEPYFLLQVFKAMTKLDTNYLRQKLLLAVDGILEEKEKLPASAVEDEEEELPAAIEIKRFVANEKRATATNTSTSKNFMRPPITPATTTANAATFASKTQLPVPSIFDSAVHNVMRAFKGPLSMFIQNLASSAKHGRFTVEQMSLLKSYLLSVISNQMVIFGLSASFSDSDEYVLISMKLDSMLSGFVNRIISQHSDGLVHDLDVFVTGIVSNAAKNSDINDIRKELALDDEEEEQFYNFTPSRSRFLSSASSSKSPYAHLYTPAMQAKSQFSRLFE